MESQERVLALKKYTLSSMFPEIFVYDYGGQIENNLGYSVLFKLKFSSARLE